MNIAADRIRHVRSHAEDDSNPEINDRCIQNLLSGAGSRSGSFRNLERYAHVMAIYSWFVDKDLSETRSWFFTRTCMQLARISYMPLHERRLAFSLASASTAAFSGCSTVFPKVGEVLKTLYSQDGDDRTLNLLSEQAGLILCGNVVTAGSMLEMQDNKDITGYGSREPDVAVFFNLHRGSDGDLRDSILRLCELSDERLDMESGYTEGLMNTPATFYLKLCQLSGRKVDVQHPMIPAAWLEEVVEKRPEFKFPRLNSVVF